jgi:hypothetical protein
MEKSLFALSLGFVGILLLPLPAWSAPQCGPREQVLSVLATKFNETRRSIGLAANAQVIEIFANAESGTWTITVSLPDGATCLVASGSNFETLSEELPAKGDPA